MTTCENGHQVEPGDLFCATCGAPLGPDTTESPATKREPTNLGHDEPTLDDMASMCADRLRSASPALLENICGVTVADIDSVAHEVAGGIIEGLQRNGRPIEEDDAQRVVAIAIFQIQDSEPSSALHKGLLPSIRKQLQALDQEAIEHVRNCTAEQLSVGIDKVTEGVAVTQMVWNPAAVAFIRKTVTKVLLELRLT